MDLLSDVAANRVLLLGASDDGTGRGRILMRVGTMLLLLALLASGLPGLRVTGVVDVGR